jgi:hypothetical protein
MSETGETMPLVWAIVSGIGGRADIAHLGALLVFGAPCPA